MTWPHHERLWEGICPETRAFCERVLREGELTSQYVYDARAWLASCRDAGVTTTLDADFDAPDMADHLDKQMRLAVTGGDHRNKLMHLRMGLRFYQLAYEHGLRERPVPPLAKSLKRRHAKSAEEVRARLPQEDQDRLAAIEQAIADGARRQWNGQGEETDFLPDGRRFKATISLKSARDRTFAINAFLRFADKKEWEPFTLPELLRPEHVVEFWYWGERWDGQWPTKATIRGWEKGLLDFFLRGRLAGVEVVTEEQEKAIRTAMRQARTKKATWHIAPKELSRTGRNKWFPDPEMVEKALVALEEQIMRAEARWKLGRIAFYSYWLAVRNAVMTMCAIFGMWRMDTVCTGSLGHLRRYGTTDDVIDENGFAVIEGIARAKNVKGDWYPFVPELKLTSIQVYWLQYLLRIEGRSFQKPLREGEHPVRLRTGDKWGDDPIPPTVDGKPQELTVVPIFRVRPDRPEGLSYRGSRDVIEDQLTRLGFESVHPHMVRVAGAIYWRYCQGMPEDLVMDLGLWEHPGALRECYARENSRSKSTRMAEYMPRHGQAAPRASRGARERAAAAAQIVITKLIMSTRPYESRRLLGELARHCQEIAQSIASELGEKWEPALRSRFRSASDDALVHEALCEKGYANGISTVVGYDYWATDELKTQARKALNGPQVPLAVRRMRAVALPPPKPRRLTPRTAPDGS